MLAVSESFRVVPNTPSKAMVVSQPPLQTISGWTIGSICLLQIGITCKQFQVQHPPTFKLVDKFGNNIDSGAWYACAELIANSSETRLYGATRVPLVDGNAVFDDIHVLEVKSEYRLKVSMREEDLHGASCDVGNAFTSATSDPFEITFSAARKLVLLQNISTTKGAGTPFTLQPQAALQDDSGNTVLQADKIMVFAQISSYRSDPRFPRDVGMSEVMPIYATCLRNPVNGRQENCREFTELGVETIEGVANFATEIGADGAVKEASLHVQYMGYYTFRFYANALVTFSHEFLVRCSW